ncbi:hypothetical protein ACP4OV_026144 [Aristida adscensionis]
MFLEMQPKLIFTEETLGLKQKEGQTDDIARDFTIRVDCILKNHSGSGVKKLKLAVFDRYNVTTCHLNSWLEKAIVPGIEEVTILLPTKYRVGYNFPCGRVNTPIVADKFIHLKYLMIYLTYGDEKCVSPSYDYLSLASFLNASPVLETSIPSVDQEEMKHDPAFGDASPNRQISEHKHDRLKKLQINGFCSAKSMVELTCHILENATSLESVTLDTGHGIRCV